MGANLRAVEVVMITARQAIRPAGVVLTTAMFHPTEVVLTSIRLAGHSTKVSKTFVRLAIHLTEVEVTSARLTTDQS